MFGDDVQDTLRFHRFLLGETNTRLESYQHAISQTVKPGDVVLDLGSGTGILSFMACRRGARKVYAVEMGDVAEFAKLLAVKNAVQDRIVFINDRSTRIDLPEPADVLVSDTFGTIGFQAGGLNAVLDARERLLKKGGAILPQSIQLFIVPVELPVCYERRIEFWKGQLFGMDLSPMATFAANNRYAVRIEPEAFLGTPAALVRIRLAKFSDLHLHGTVSVTVDRPGLVHGLCGWFTAELTPDVLLSNSPIQTTTNYAQTFFPLLEPVRVEKEDRLTLSLQTFDEAEWHWQMRVNEGPSVSHSTFFGFPLAKDALRKQASDYVPTLSQAGETERFLLSLVDGNRTISELEGEVVRRYAGSFKSREEVSAFVRDVVRRCA
jgi:protein arginine N-methyltransferase 1